MNPPYVYAQRSVKDHMVSFRSWFIAALCSFLFVSAGLISILNAVDSQSSIVKVSYSNNRSNPFNLAGSQVSGKIYVFVDSPNLSKVVFNLDNTVDVTEKYTPFDLAKTSWFDLANPTDTSQLSVGSHTLRVSAIYKDGSVKNEVVNFNVVRVNQNVVTTTTTVKSSPTVTTAPVTTTTRPVPITQPDQSSRNWIIHASDQETESVELFVSRIDGSQKTRLTNDSRYSNVWPRVTPDGKTVYFYRLPPNISTANYFEYSLWKINLDGTGLKEVLPKGANGWWLQGHVDISPDGRNLVFAALVPFQGLKMFVSDLEGKNLQEIPTSTVGPIDPAWTPDGRILFTANPPDKPSNGDSTLEVYITNRNGTGEKRLTFDNLRDHDPVMSPDGKKISFLTQEDPTYRIVGRWTQRIMNSDGTGLYTLISRENFSANPYWVSNDSTVYAYFDWEKAGWGIKVSKIDGSKTDILVAPQNAVGLDTAFVQDPFAFAR